MAYKDDSNLKVFDMVMPVKSLPTRKLVLLEKQFADVPKGGVRSIKCNAPVTEHENTNCLDKKQQAEWEAELKKCGQDQGDNVLLDCEYKVF